MIRREKDKINYQKREDRKSHFAGGGGVMNKDSFLQLSLPGALFVT